MNVVCLMGNLTKDPDVRYTTGENPMAVARYTLAVRRAVGRQDQEADFINCICFGKRAEFAEKHLKKGTKIAVDGRIQTGSYKDKEGKTVYTTTVVVEDHYFCESKKTEPKDDSKQTEQKDDGFMSTEGGELPFN